MDPLAWKQRWEHCVHAKLTTDIRPSDLNFTHYRFLLHSQRGCTYMMHSGANFHSTTNSQNPGCVRYPGGFSVCNEWDFLAHASGCYHHKSA